MRIFTADDTQAPDGLNEFNAVPVRFVKVDTAKVQSARDAAEMFIDAMNFATGEPAVVILTERSLGLIAPFLWTPGNEAAVQLLATSLDHETRKEVGDMRFVAMLLPSHNEGQYFFIVLGPTEMVFYEARKVDGRWHAVNDHDLQDECPDGYPEDVWQSLKTYQKMFFG